MNDPHEPTADAVDSEIRRVCSLLESIAKQYPEDSAESLALRDAATAYIVVQQRKSLSLAYQNLKAGVDGKLTERMKVNLQQRGIDPDDLENDG